MLLIAAIAIETGFDADTPVPMQRLAKIFHQFGVGKAAVSQKDDIGFKGQ
ncbi:MAG: hypothetical protein K8R89_07820 [Anaerolineae bacterium]|nr:hypothetical protein [Anaerolineae bacterium]